MWVVEGLVDADPGLKANVAVILRMQHVLADGPTALNIFSRLCSTQSDPAPPAPIAGVGTVSKRRIVLDGLVRFACKPWYLIKTLSSALVAVLFNARKLRRSAGGKTAPGWFGRMPNAPQTPFNGNITNRRTAAYVQLNLTDVKAVKDRFGATVNDVMLAVVSGALRRFLLDRTALPQAALLAMMPVADSYSARVSRNQFAIRMTSLHSDITDPAKRIEAIAEMSSLAKQHTSAIGASLLQDWLQMLSRPVCDRSTLLQMVRAQRGAGPCTTWLCLTCGERRRRNTFWGRRLAGRYAFGPIVHGGGLQIIVMSLNGKLDIGLVRPPDLVPDLWGLADRIPGCTTRIADCGG